VLETAATVYILLIFLISAATLELTESTLIRPSCVSERLPNWSAGMKINLIQALRKVHACHAQNMRILSHFLSSKR
jgi:hypothetical protein